MDADKTHLDARMRNPVTREVHRRQVFWQIYFPLILFGILVITTIILAIFAENQQVSKLADISLIFLISIALIGFLFMIVFLVYVNYYLRRGLKATPFFMFDVQRFTYLLEVRVKLISNVAVEPILKLNSFLAGARALWSRR